MTSHPTARKTMHVLRAEKGYVIVGQDTDGSVTPTDLGMDWMVSKTKDFIGKRSLVRSDMLRENRKQLVGLVTEQPEMVLPEGTQLVNETIDRLSGTNDGACNLELLQFYLRTFDCLGTDQRRTQSDGSFCLCADIGRSVYQGDHYKSGVLRRGK